MYIFDTLNPLIHIWSGEFIHEAGTPYSIPDKKLDHDYKLYIVRKGNFEFYVDKTLYKLSEGDCCLVPPFSHTHGSKSSNDALIFGWSHFLGDGKKIKHNNPIFIRGIDEIVTNGESPTLNHLIVLPTKFKLKEPEYIYQLFRQLINLFSLRRYSERSCDYMLGFFLIELSNDFLTNEALLHTKKPSDVEYIAEWIRVHLAENPTVKDVASEFELNSTYLTRKFHTQYGISVKSYIVEQKIIHARYLLLTTNLTIAEVAEQSFFENPKHFAKSFKKLTGVPPTIYRKTYSSIHMSSKSIDPKPAIPKELGTSALRNAIKEILNDDIN